MVKLYSDLERLPHLNRNTIRNLHAAGIMTVAQFAELSIEEMQQVKGIKKTAYALRANAQAYVQNAPIWYGELPDAVRRGGWLLDLETLALINRGGDVWCIGWSDMSGNTQIAVVGGYSATLHPAEDWTVHIVPDADAAWYAVLDSMQHDDLPIFHWTGFDAGIMASTAPEVVREALLGRMHDLYSSFIATVRLPQRSYSIKEVARYIGFEWEVYARWDAAERDYHQWEIDGDRYLLYRACAYQRDDVLAMVRLMEWIHRYAP
jgi:uncharacterized protein